MKKTTKTTLVSGLAAALVIMVSLSGCVTPVARETTLTRDTGARVSDVTFDTSFSREQYVILGSISGEGSVERVLVGDEPRERSIFSWLVPRSYYVLDYDRSLGTWVDEGRLNIDTMTDRKVAPDDWYLIDRMELIAARVALARALDSMPEADAVLSPRYEFTYRMDDRVVGGELVLSRNVEEVTARLTGIAVRIKSDEELYETYRRFPGLIDSDRSVTDDLSLAPAAGQ